MDERELQELEKRYQAATQKIPKVTIPKGADAEDIATYLRLAKNAKQILAKASAAQDGEATSKTKAYLDELKRVARARAMQRELSRFDQTEKPFITPFPDLDPHVFSPRFER
jgi:hypothetical protein